jgi:hypothetical protein
MVDLPFEEIQNSDVRIRIFSPETKDNELKWHWDEDDRHVMLIGESDWKFQFDNDLPIPFPKNIIIPKMTWHRVIKGSGGLKIAVNSIDLDRFSLSE